MTMSATPIPFTERYPVHGQTILLVWPNPATPPEERVWNDAWNQRFDWSDMKWMDATASPTPETTRP